MSALPKAVQAQLDAAAAIEAEMAAASAPEGNPEPVETVVETPPAQPVLPPPGFAAVWRSGARGGGPDRRADMGAGAG